MIQGILFLIIVHSLNGLKISFFTTSFGGSGSDEIQDCVELDNLGFACVGTTDSFTTASLFLAILNSDGDVIDFHKYDSGNVDRGMEIIQSQDGHFIVCGESNDQFLVMKISGDDFSVLQEIILCYYTTLPRIALYASAVSLVEDSDGSIMIFGEYFTTVTDRKECLFVKLESDFGVGFTKTQGHVTTDEGCTGMATTSTGYIISGMTKDIVECFMVNKLDIDGSQDWGKRWCELGFDSTFVDIKALDDDDGYIAVGNSVNTGDDSKKMVLMKFSTDGTYDIFIKEIICGSGECTAESLEVVEDGYLISANSGEDEGNMLLLKFDASGNLEWKRRYNGTVDDTLNRVIRLSEYSDDNYLGVGKFHSNNNAYISRFEDSGNNFCCQFIDFETSITVDTLSLPRYGYTMNPSVTDKVESANPVMVESEQTISQDVECLISACSPQTYGEYCNISFCGDSLSNQTDEVCSGHGECVGIDDCECFSGYNRTSNISCDSWYCGAYEKSESPEEICSGGKGLCIAPDECNCTTGYSGALCNEYSCNGIKVHDLDVADNVCQRRGICESPDVCICDEIDDEEEDHYYSYEGQDCDIKFGNYFVRATYHSFIVYFEVDESDLSEYYQISLDDDHNSYFDCDSVIGVQTGQLVHNNVDIDLLKNCSISNMYEETVFSGSSQLMIMDLSHLDDDILAQFVDNLEELTVSINPFRNFITVKIFPNEHTFGDRETVYSTEYLDNNIQNRKLFTLRTFSQSEDNIASEDDDNNNNEELRSPSGGYDQCKEMLMEEDQCVQIYECYPNVLNSVDQEERTYEYYSLGFIPSLSSEEYKFAKFYFSSLEECESSSSSNSGGGSTTVRRFQTFSLVTCSGSSLMKDNFIVYENCKSDFVSLLLILFDSQVMLYFFIGTLPLYLMIFLVLVFVVLCMINNCCFCSREILRIIGCWDLTDWKKKRSKDSIQEENNDTTIIRNEGDEDEDEEVSDQNSLITKKHEDEFYIKQEENGETTSSSSSSSGENEESSTLQENEEDEIKRQEQEQDEEEKEESDLEDEKFKPIFDDDTEDELDEKSSLSYLEEAENSLMTIKQEIEKLQNIEPSPSKSLSQLKEKSDSYLLEIQQEKENVDNNNNVMIKKNATTKKIIERIVRKNSCCCECFICFYFNLFYCWLNNSCCSCFFGEKNSFYYGCFFDSFKCLLMIMIILCKEGFAIWFSCSEFLDTGDIDPNNEHYIVQSAILTVNQYLIWVTIGLYLFIYFMFIFIYIVQFQYFRFLNDPFMFCVGFGALREYVYYRIFKSLFLIWFLSVNLYSYIIKFVYLDRFEREKQLGNPNFYFSIIFPSALLIFTFFDVLGYNGVSSNAHFEKLKNKSWVDYLVKKKFPKVNIGISKLGKDCDVILEDFFQILFLIDKNIGSEKTTTIEEYVEKLSESEEYGHLSWEYLDGNTKEDIMFIKDFFFPPFVEDEYKKESYWTIFHHHRISSTKWMISFCFFPLLCLCRVSSL